jgi:hypothetical protein
MNRKEAIVKGPVEARKRIVDKASRLTPEAQNEVFLGCWKIKDLLAHLIGWNYTNIQAVTDIRSGNTPHVFEHWDPSWE